MQHPSPHPLAPPLSYTYVTPLLIFAKMILKNVGFFVVTEFCKSFIILMYCIFCRYVSFISLSFASAGRNPAWIPNRQRTDETLCLTCCYCEESSLLGQVQSILAEAEQLCVPPEHWIISLSWSPLQRLTYLGLMPLTPGMWVSLMCLKLQGGPYQQDHLMSNTQAQLLVF